METKDIVKVVAGSILLVVALMTVWGSAFTTPNGTVNIVTAFGKATRVAQPGLGFKVPFRDSTQEFDVRTRLVEGTYQAAAKPEEGNNSIGLGVTAVVSVNWTANASTAMQLFTRHGKLTDFERIILQTKIGAAVKSGISQFTPKEMLDNRTGAESSIKSNLEAALLEYSDFLVINSVQLDQLGFPKAYTDAIEAEQIASKAADAALQETRRKLNLDQQIVNAALKQKQADAHTADAAAYAVERAAEAEAKRISQIGDAELAVLKAKAAIITPELTSFTMTERWNGVQPTHMLGESSNLLLSVD